MAVNCNFLISEVSIRSKLHTNKSGSGGMNQDIINGDFNKNSVDEKQ